jgi:integrase
MALTDLTVRTAKPEVRLAKTSKGAVAHLPEDVLRPRLTKLSDGGGLQLWVTPGGAKLWRLAYRFGPKQKMLALGVYPAMSLKEAREARDNAKKLIAAGQDPSQVKRAKRIAQAVAAAHTFEAIAEELIAKKQCENKAPRTIKKMRWLLSFALPLLGARPIREITAADVLVVLRLVEGRGRHDSASALRTLIGQVFRYAIATARADTDPSRDLRDALIAPTVQHRAAIIEPKKFGGLLRAIDSYDGQPETRLALELLALTFVRPGELRAAEWCEFDLDAAVWSIPASKMKMRRPHRVPLSERALQILRDLQKIARGPFLFPSGRTAVRPMSENTINAALRRLGYAKDEHTGHGFRSSASSMLNASGLWHADAIERQLAHVDADSVRRAYARDPHWEERVRMMAWWANRCNELRGAMPAAQAA